MFDAFKARLQESNSKVNLYALESLPKIISLLKDSLSQVVHILVPAVVDNHLNSKNNAVYYAAIDAMNALILNLGTCVACLKLEVISDSVISVLWCLFVFLAQIIFFFFSLSAPRPSF